MLKSLLESVTQGLLGRNLEFTKVAALVGHAKEIHYSTVRIPSNVLQIEEALEEEGIFDTLMILRSYLILHAQWELGKDWWEIVDAVKSATGVVCGPVTANADSKQEYYRETYTTLLKYMGHQSPEQGGMTQDLWRNNDWLVVLWLLSFLPVSGLEQLR